MSPEETDCFDVLDAALRRGAGSLANHDEHFNAAFTTRTLRDMKKIDWIERQDLGRPLSNYPTRNDKLSNRPPPGVYLYATRDIKYGEEILANYGSNYGFEDAEKHKTIVQSRNRARPKRNSNASLSTRKKCRDKKLQEASEEY